jgi:uncharacterized protein YndB with AHSA1/START domain
MGCGIIVRDRGRGGTVAPITHSVEIARTPDDAFAYITDPSRFTEWQEAVVSARLEGDGPMRQGSRLNMTRLMGRRQQKFTTELTEYSPPRSYAFRGIDGPIRPIGKGSVEPVGDGERSRFTFAIDFEGKGFGKLLVPLVRSQARKELVKTHEKLKERLESGAA